MNLIFLWFSQDAQEIYYSELFELKNYWIEDIKRVERKRLRERKTGQYESGSRQYEPGSGQYEPQFGQ